jgi:DNA (cytosine-5)-methyltransferase 1
MDSAPIADPLHTLTAGGGHHGLAVPFMADVNHGGGENRVQSLGETLGTVTTHNGKAVCVPFVTQWDHQGSRSDYNRPVAGPLATMLTKASMGVTVPWLSPYYGNSTASDVGSPVETITTKDRHSLCVAMCQGPQDWPTPETDAMRVLQATMLKLGVCDIGFRMLSNPELSAAQGFPSDYIYCGKKAEITRQIGNSVSPPVAEAITRAILSA